MDVGKFVLCMRAFLCALPMILRIAKLLTKRRKRLARRKQKRDGEEEPKYLILAQISERKAFIERITQDTIRECFRNLRMYNQAFLELCMVLQVQCGLKFDPYISITEKVTIFLRTLAHHEKNRILQSDFQRSGHTISMMFHGVLRAVIKLHKTYLAKPTPVDENTADRRAASALWMVHTSL